MAYTTRLGNYVKFMRGTPNDWAALSKAEKDPDTLYFISELNGSSGKLYLGPKLISVGNGTVSDISLKDITDILLSENIPADSFLVYDKDKDKWVNKPASEVLAVVVKEMKGATASSDGETGLVPVPTQGQQDLFLRGDATWADPTAELKQTVSTLIGDDTDKSIREITRSEIQTVIGTASTAFDTLGEIEQWIKDHEKEVDTLDLNSKVTNLTNIVINGVPGTDGEIETPSLIQQVDNLNTDLTKLNDAVFGKDENPGLVATVANNVEILKTHTEDIKEIKEALHWQDLSIA